MLEIDSKAGEVVIRDTVLIVLGFIVGSNSGESADRCWVSCGSEAQKRCGDQDTEYREERHSFKDTGSE